MSAIEVSAVWANNRRTFYSTSEHVDAPPPSGRPDVWS